MFNSKYITMQSRMIILLCLFCFNINAQVNLIPNPSFEDSLGIPQSHSEFNKTKDWYTICGSVDYFSKYSPTTVTVSFGASVGIPKNCMGYQNAKHGNFYTGIIPRSTNQPTTAPFHNWRECFGVKLNQKLLANHSYSFTMFVSLADAAGISSNQLQALFTANQFTTNNDLYDTTSYHNYLDYQISYTSFITDTSNWIPITSCFIADGGEEYLSIGNFKDAIKTSAQSVNNTTTTCSMQQFFNTYSYIFIDDLSLYDMGLYIPASARNDTLICKGTSLNISSNPLKDSSDVVWNPPTALSCTNCPNPIATPTISTLYYVNKSICGASSKDSILVRVHTPTTNPTPFSDETICLNEIKQIGFKDSTNFTSYSWFPAYALTCTNCAAPYASPDITTTYTLTRTECSTSFNNTVTVTVDDCNPTYTVPNVFTPNYDDVNDTWGIKFSNTKYIKNFQMHIYDRWGLLVYSTNPDINTPNSKWDGHTSAGTECSAGVYFYVISFDKNEEHVELKGSLSLFR